MLHKCYHLSTWRVRRALYTKGISPWSRLLGTLLYDGLFLGLTSVDLEVVIIFRTMCDIVVVSIYINPTQFSKNEDFGVYPKSIVRFQGCLSFQCKMCENTTCFNTIVCRRQTKKS